MWNDECENGHDLWPKLSFIMWMKCFKVSKTSSTPLIVHALIQSHPNFTYLPEREEHTLPHCLPPSWAGQTINQSNAYLTSNLNSISLCRIHTTADPNHPKSELFWMSVCAWVCVCMYVWEINKKKRKTRGPEKKAKRRLRLSVATFPFACWRDL